jgi:hypothetical protein
MDTCECYGGATGTFCEHYVYPDMVVEKKEDDNVQDIIVRKPN